MEKRTINTETIKETIIDLVYKANFMLPGHVLEKIKNLRENDESELAQKTLQVLEENAVIAKSDSIPLCQDCGVVIIFAEIGQDVVLEGENFESSINKGIATAYEKYYLRKSIVSDPLKRNNTGTNTPAFVHTDIVPGQNIKLTVYLKGGGSENMTSLMMFRPTDPINLIIDYIEKTVINAGPNPCPPLFLGIGIGGTADTALLNSKKAVLRSNWTGHKDPYYRDLEVQIEERLNRTNIGPLGFGGRSTVAGVFIKEAPCHIANLPVALNLNCHSLRYWTARI